MLWDKKTQVGDGRRCDRHSRRNWGNAPSTWRLKGGAEGYGVGVGPGGRAAACCPGLLLPPAWQGCPGRLAGVKDDRVTPRAGGRLPTTGWGLPGETLC